MNFWQINLLALVQAISEFIPISSDGHLNLFSYVLGLKPSLALDIFLNTATFFSVLVYFRKRIKDFIKLLPYVIVGSVPAGIAGVFFKSWVESISANVVLLPFFFMITAISVLSTKLFSTQKKPISYKNAFIIGIFQALAILPGVSRSGMTIFAALLFGLSSSTAFDFSFFLFIPASFGAIILSLNDSSFTQYVDLQYLFPFGLAFAVGLVALGLLRKLVISRNFWLFGIYTLVLSLTLSTLLLTL